MPVICPTVTAYSAEEYHAQMEKIAGFAERIQIDLTDGKFTSEKTVNPQDAWWPVGIKADFHLMFQNPASAADTILEHKPNMIIIHSEAEGNFLGLADRCRRLGVKIGVALLPRTSPGTIVSALPHIDHVLIFSGNLGHQGGSHANLDLLRKVRELKDHKPGLEVGWDGGINTHNISQLASGGVDVFNVGGFLQQSTDPEKDYRALARIAEETGTT